MNLLQLWSCGSTTETYCEIYIARAALREGGTGFVVSPNIFDRDSRISEDDLEALYFRTMAEAVTDFQARIKRLLALGKVANTNPTASRQKMWAVK